MSIQLNCVCTHNSLMSWSYIYTHYNFEENAKISIYIVLIFIKFVLKMFIKFCSNLAPSPNWSIYP